MKLESVKMQYLTEMTLSTSFFASWKVLTPSERPIRSENRQKINMWSATAGEKLKGHMTEKCAVNDEVYSAFP